jgi:predicted DNA-binding transcriptional regulator YafY
MSMSGSRSFALTCDFVEIVVIICPVLLHNQQRIRGSIDAALLLDLSEAIQQRRRTAIDYNSSHHDEFTHRTVEPYGLAGWWGRWYLVGYCQLRKGYRLFRLDRIQAMQVLGETFTRPEDFDVQAYMTSTWLRPQHAGRSTLSFTRRSMMLSGGRG